MRTQTLRTATGTALLLHVLVGAALLADPDLPEAVQQALDREFPNADIEEVEHEAGAGIPCYEIEIGVAGRECELLVAESGDILQIEQELSGLRDLPPRVAARIRQATGNARITEIEKVELRATIRGRSVIALPEPRILYEIEMRTPGRRGEREMMFNADGDPLRRHHRGDNDDDEDDEDDEDD